MNFRLPLVLVICIALICGACSSRKAPSSTINGALSFVTPIEFSGSAQLQLLLTDVSVEGTAPEVATATVDIKRLPYQYSLPYDASSINPNHRYTVSARIYIDKNLKFATDSAVEILTQGKGSYADFAVIATGTAQSATTSMQQVATEIFQGEIRNANDISLYRGGVIDGHIVWLEEDRSNGTPTPAHNRYEFKGALLMRYADSTSLELLFDDTGKPKSVTRNGKAMAIAQEMNAINAARNRASLLRAHALARRESQMHRKATKNDVN
jgi:putative lipoprotein